MFIETRIPLLTETRIPLLTETRIPLLTETRIPLFTETRIPLLTETRISPPRSGALNLAVGFNPRWRARIFSVASATGEFRRGFQPTVGAIIFSQSRQRRLNQPHK